MKKSSIPMNPVYLKEFKKYSHSDLQKLLCLEDEEYLEVIKQLKAKGILKESKESRYVFQFVGVIICKHKLLFCLPKYLVKSDPKETMKQLLLLFQEYSRREKLSLEELETFGDQNSPSALNYLSVTLFLIQDYLENGLYHNDKNIYVLNGDNGEIDWTKTINDEYAIIKENQPIYLDFYVRSVINDESDYFRMLHMYVLTSCTKILDELGLSEYLRIPKVEFDVDGTTLGTKEVILSRIMNEITVQYVNRKQMILKAIAAFISNDKIIKDDLNIEFFGSKNFEVVWEKICGFVFDNKYEKVKEYIDKPLWKPLDGEGHLVDTLKPDIVSVFQKKRKKYFIISDAKYYSIFLSESDLKNNPGVGDVTKQYLYELAFRKLIVQLKIDYVHNLLLFPTEQDSINYIGEVSIEFLKALELENIKIVLLPAHMVFDMYIEFKRIDLKSFCSYLDLLYKRQGDRLKDSN